MAIKRVNIRAIRERLSIWVSLDAYHKWELFGVWLHLRCAACGWWKWQPECCAEHHWFQECHCPSCRARSSK